MVSRLLKVEDSILIATASSSNSYLWKGIIWGRDLLANGLRIRIDNGLTTNFFKDKWVPRESSDFFALTQCGFYGFWLHHLFKQWDIRKLRSLVMLFFLFLLAALKKGTYTVRSGYKLGMNIRFSTPQLMKIELGSGGIPFGSLKFHQKLRCFCGEYSTTVCLVWEILLREGLIQTQIV